VLTEVTDIHGVWPPGWRLFEGNAFQPTPDDVPVPIYAAVPGLWVRVPGVDGTGQPVDATGAVVAGPDHHGDMWAVQVRDYTTGTDVVVYVPDGGGVWMVEPRPEWRAAHNAAPIHAPGAAHIRFMRWVPGPGRDRRDRECWTTFEGTDATERELSDLDADPDVIIVSIVRQHLAIGA
jgi:hypothetical protein